MCETKRWGHSRIYCSCSPSPTIAPPSSPGFPRVKAQNSRLCLSVCVCVWLQKIYKHRAGQGERGMCRSSHGFFYNTQPSSHLPTPPPVPYLLPPARPLPLPIPFSNTCLPSLCTHVLPPQRVPKGPPIFPPRGILSFVFFVHHTTIVLASRPHKYTLKANKMIMANEYIYMLIKIFRRGWGGEEPFEC